MNIKNICENKICVDDSLMYSYRSKPSISLFKKIITDIFHHGNIDDQQFIEQCKKIKKMYDTSCFNATRKIVSNLLADDANATHS